MAYDRVEPIGPAPDRYLAALTIAVTANMWRTSGRALTPEQVWAEAREGFTITPTASPQERVMAQRSLFRAIAASQRARKARTARRPKAPVSRPERMPQPIVDARAPQPHHPRTI